MVLNEKWCYRNALKRAFDCPWKAEIYCETTKHCFSKTAILHLQQLVFQNCAFSHMFIALYSLKL